MLILFAEYGILTILEQKKDRELCNIAINDNATIAGIYDSANLLLQQARQILENQRDNVTHPVLEISSDSIEKSTDSLSRLQFQRKKKNPATWPKERIRWLVSPCKLSNISSLALRWSLLNYEKRERARDRFGKSNKTYTRRSVEIFSKRLETRRHSPRG